jgi:hypothetical protein
VESNVQLPVSVSQSRRLTVVTQYSKVSTHTHTGGGRKKRALLIDTASITHTYTHTHAHTYTHTHTRTHASLDRSDDEQADSVDGLSWPWAGACSRAAVCRWGTEPLRGGGGGGHGPLRAVVRAAATNARPGPGSRRL